MAGKEEREVASKGCGVEVPNAESREAMREIETGEGLVRLGNAEELFRDLKS